MKLCQTCGGSGNHFFVKDGKPTWEKCLTCEGKGVVLPFTDPTDEIELEEWLERYEQDGGMRA